MLYYYKNKNGDCTERSFPLILDDEQEISESEFNAYMLEQSKLFADK